MKKPEKTEEEREKKKARNAQDYEKTKEARKVADQVDKVFIPMMRSIGDDTKSLKNDQEDLKAKIDGRLEELLVMTKRLIEENTELKLIICASQAQTIDRNDQNEQPNAYGQILDRKLIASTSQQQYASPSVAGVPQTLNPEQLRDMERFLLDEISPTGQMFPEVDHGPALVKDQHYPPQGFYNSPTGTVEVSGFVVSEANKFVAEKVFAEHSDVAANFKTNYAKIRNTAMDSLCDAVGLLKHKPVEAETLQKVSEIIKYLERNGLEVSWLRTHYKRVKESLESEIRKSKSILEKLI